MSTLAAAAEQHRIRIVAEVVSAVWHDHTALHKHGRDGVEAEVGELLDALVMRVRMADDAHLTTLLKHHLRRGDWPAAVLLAALVRLAAAVRAVLPEALSSPRALNVASAALDRAVAEVMGELMGDLRAAPGDEIPAAPSTTRDPSLIRNIRELLAQSDETLSGTVLAVALRGDDPRTAAATVRQSLKDVGARVVMDHAQLLAAALSGGVGNADPEDALGLALGLVKNNIVRGAGIGIARGPFTLRASPQGPLAVGETLERALALATTAKPGVILTDAAVEAAVGQTYALRRVAAIETAFRLDADQPLWLDRWEQAALVQDPTFVGRDKERATLRGIMRAPGKHLVIVGLCGRAGSGRLRLLQEVLRELKVPAARVLVAAPHPVAAIPYWPVMRICRRLLGLGEGPVREAELRERTQHLATPAGAAPIDAPLRSLLGTEEAEAVLNDAVDPTALRLEIAKALCFLVEAAALAQPEQPMVIVVRDADNLDLPSLHALTHLTAAYRGNAPLILALTYRGNFRPPKALVDAGLGELPVSPLADGDIEALARSMLDEETLPESTVALLHGRSRGLPMTAVLLVRYLVELGALHRRDAGWHAATPVKLTDVPRRQIDLWARRMGRLPAKLNGLLQAAATVGESLAWQTLELMAVSRGMARDEVEASVGLLVEMGFLRREDDALRFTHPLIRQVAERMQSERERQDTHKLALVAYRERYPDALRQIPAVIFHHCVEAGDALGAREAAVHAIRRALLLHDGKRGLAIAAQALSLPRDDGVLALRVEFDLREARERILDARGERDRQKDEIKEMVALGERLADQVCHGVALHRAARLNLLVGDLPRARTLANKALALLAQADPLPRSNALRTLALILWQERQPAAAAAALTEALHIYDGIGHRRGMGYVLHNLGVFALESGALPQARAHFERALAIKQETGDPYGRAALLDALGQLAALAAQPQLAAERFEEALALRQSAGHLTGVVQSLVHLSEATREQNAARAVELAREAVTQARKRQRDRLRIEAELALAQALVAQGDREAALRAATQAVRASSDAGSPVLLARARVARAEILLAYHSKARLRQAASVAQAAAQTAESAAATLWHIEALTIQAVALRRLGDSAAEVVAAQARALIDGKGTPPARAEALRQRLTTQ